MAQGVGARRWCSGVTHGGDARGWRTGWPQKTECARVRAPHTHSGRRVRTLRGCARIQGVWSSRPTRSSSQRPSPGQQSAALPSPFETSPGRPLPPAIPTGWPGSWAKVGPGLPRVGAAWSAAGLQEGGGLAGDKTPNQFLGRWFTAGLASNSSWIREKKPALSMCTSLVAPTEDGGLNLTVTFLRKDQCETRTLLLQPAGPPGCYSYTSQHWGSVNDVRVVETDYGEYALLHTESTKGPGQDFHMATLYSRTQTPKAEVKEKFTAFAKAQGFTEDSIVFLPQTDKCMEGHQ